MFQKEDIVRLKCGSCNMIVESTEAYGGETHVTCVWFDMNNENHKTKFKPWTLELVKRERPEEVPASVTQARGDLIDNVRPRRRP